MIPLESVALLSDEDIYKLQILVLVSNFYTNCIIYMYIYTMYSSIFLGFQISPSRDTSIKC
jgi:hypothetical protein